MRVDDRSEKEYSGRLHVDYAQARDDQYEFECAQRALLRQHRHRSRSPTNAVHYSDTEAVQLLEKLKGTESLARIFGLNLWFEYLAVWY